MATAMLIFFSAKENEMIMRLKGKVGKALRIEAERIPYSVICCLLGASKWRFLCLVWHFLSLNYVEAL
jgi:hypothetical protein